MSAKDVEKHYTLVVKRLKEGILVKGEKRYHFSEILPDVISLIKPVITELERHVLPDAELYQTGHSGGNDDMRYSIVLASESTSIAKAMYQQSKEERKGFGCGRCRE